MACGRQLWQQQALGENQLLDFAFASWRLHTPHSHESIPMLCQCASCVLTVGHSLYTTGGGGGGGGPAAAAAQYPELYWMIVAPCNMLPVRKTTTRRLLFEPFDTKKGPVRQDRLGANIAKRSRFSRRASTRTYWRRSCWDGSRSWAGCACGGGRTLRTSAAWL